ncbi:acetyl-CoA carboxylase biotin carboxyl carrier protein subunit [Bordetella tumulicola]|uniref:acetyl-CoA carboxylase biotin carboxyl carrier protein subunit n=1 Tax=Bordetella tumulicola TaxID=1649133 RepID=UPI0039EEF0BD
MKKIVSNVAGRLAACHVVSGAQVQLGDELFIVESMKMEIPVESEFAGTVVDVLVSVGDEIEEGQELALLE